MSTQPRPTNPQLEAFRAGFNSLSRGRQIAIVAAVIGLIDSFLPWYHYGSGLYSGSANGWTDWGLLAILGFVVAGVLILLPMAGLSVRGLAPTLPPTVTDATLVMAAGGISLLTTIIYMLSMGISGMPSQGPTFGSFIALVCALAIIAGGYLLQQEPTAV